MNLIEKLGITPGPWKWGIEDDTISQSIYVSKVEDGKADADICCLSCNNYSADSERYDAALIAAAPEMLEALIDHAYEIRAWITPNNDVINVIEKATGKTWAEVKELIK